MTDRSDRPGVTRTRVAINRLPPEHRPRLVRLARRAHQVCRSHGAKLLAEVSLALEVAILDLEGAELRAGNAERRARGSEAALGVARARIVELERYINDLPRFDEWGTSDPTAVRDPPPDLIVDARSDR